MPEPQYVLRMFLKFGKYGKTESKSSYKLGCHKTGVVF